MKKRIFIAQRQIFLYKSCMCACTLITPGFINIYLSVLYVQCIFSKVDLNLTTIRKLGLNLYATRAPRGTDRSPEYNEHFCYKLDHCYEFGLLL